MLAKRTDVVRRLGRPQWVPEGTLEDVLCDGTWNRPTVFKADDGVWRALYNGVTYENGERVVLGMMAAESSDGIHWERPDFSSRVSFANRRRPNQVYMANNGGPAFYDAREEDPARRLKLLYSARPEWSAQRGQRFITSPDGIHWTEAGGWGERILDAPISLFYNDQRGTYIVCNRPINGDRRVAFMETKDFKHFTAPEIAVSPDPDDPPLTEFYGMTVFPYEGLFVGLLLVMHVDGSSQLHKRQGYVDGGLTYSYNGWHFNRALHETFVPRNDRSEQGGGCVYPSSLVVDDQQRIRIYSGGSRAGHFHLPEPLDAAVMLHTLRLDGFMYLEPTGLMGRVTTRPLQIHGGALKLNVKAPHGRVRAQFVERTGEPVPGFRLDESVPFSGDDLFHTPTWTSGKGPETLVGKDVHLELELTNAELYAIRGDFSVVIGSGTWPAASS